MCQNHVVSAQRLHGRDATSNQSIVRAVSIAISARHFFGFTETTRAGRATIRPLAHFFSSSGSWFFALSTFGIATSNTYRSFGFRLQ